ncbi:conserved hypothetical protein [uncultured Dysgonomonas sp.]|uniref:Uncharacterized protein n=1 Tax=uncultured Dysgonomonas sp. TaxID=206096 RepID=A0A212J780_9BACT|nr:hypothetical protein [uncultured Dysgonomonas sp.]SBV95264.1 conserved hypothetical protein [uncultured Dysgonomonas sp.]
MYVKLQGHIEIHRQDRRKLSFDAFNSVEIEKDIFNIKSSCKIKIPISSRLEHKATGQTESVQTAKQFSRGDKIHISLGYSGRLYKEFTGFIYRLNYKTPLEIECEGYEYQLRRPCETKTWASTSMKEVLEFLIKGTDIKLSEDVPEIKFPKFIIPANMTRLEALQMVKDKYGVAIFFIDNLLYAGLAYTLDRGTVKYKLGWNTIKDDSLKYRNADDVSLKIKAVWIKPDNTKLEAQVGDPSGSLRTLFFYNVSSKAELEKLGKEEIKKYKYSGYEGKITTFLEPFAQPGMKGELSDPKYSERDGTYYITKVNVKADTSGGRRTVEFTVKL